MGESGKDVKNLWSPSTKKELEDMLNVFFNASLGIVPSPKEIAEKEQSITEHLERAKGYTKTAVEQKAFDDIQTVLNAPIRWDDKQAISTLFYQIRGILNTL